MTPKLYKTREGYELVNSSSELWQLVQIGGKWQARKFGLWSPKWTPTGKLVNSIPNNIKSIFFQTQKQAT